MATEADVPVAISISTGEGLDRTLKIEKPVDIIDKHPEFHTEKQLADDENARVEYTMEAASKNNSFEISEGEIFFDPLLEISQLEQSNQAGMELPKKEVQPHNGSEFEESNEEFAEDIENHDTVIGAGHISEVEESANETTLDQHVQTISKQEDSIKEDVQCLEKEAEISEADTKGAEKEEGNAEVITCTEETRGVQNTPEFSEKEEATPADCPKEIDTITEEVSEATSIEQETVEYALPDIQTAENQPQESKVTKSRDFEAYVEAALQDEKSSEEQAIQETSSSLVEEETTEQITREEEVHETNIKEEVKCEEPIEVADATKETGDEAIEQRAEANKDINVPLPVEEAYAAESPKECVEDNTFLSEVSEATTKEVVQEVHSTESGYGLASEEVNQATALKEAAAETKEHVSNTPEQEGLETTLIDEAVVETEDHAQKEESYSSETMKKDIQTAEDEGNADAGIAPAESLATMAPDQPSVRIKNIELQTEENVSARDKLEEQTSAAAYEGEKGFVESQPENDEQATITDTTSEVDSAPTILTEQIILESEKTELAAEENVVSTDYLEKETPTTADEGEDISTIAKSESEEHVNVTDITQDKGISTILTSERSLETEEANVLPKISDNLNENKEHAEENILETIVTEETSQGIEYTDAREHFNSEDAAEQTKVDDYDAVKSENEILDNSQTIVNETCETKDVEKSEEILPLKYEGQQEECSSPAPTESLKDEIINENTSAEVVPSNDAEDSREVSQTEAEITNLSEVKPEETTPSPLSENVEETICTKEETQESVNISSREVETTTEALPEIQTVEEKIIEKSDEVLPMKPDGDQQEECGSPTPTEALNDENITEDTSAEVVPSNDAADSLEVLQKYETPDVEPEETTPEPSSDNVQVICAKEETQESLRTSTREVETTTTEELSEIQTVEEEEQKVEGHVEGTDSIAEAKSETLEHETIPEENSNIFSSEKEIEKEIPEEYSSTVGSFGTDAKCDALSFTESTTEDKEQAESTQIAPEVIDACNTSLQGEALVEAATPILEVQDEIDNSEYVTETNNKICEEVPEEPVIIERDFSDDQITDGIVANLNAEPVEEHEIVKDYQGEEKEIEKTDVEGSGAENINEYNANDVSTERVSDEKVKECIDEAVERKEEITEDNAETLTPELSNEDTIQNSQNSEHESIELKEEHASGLSTENNEDALKSEEEIHEEPVTEETVSTLPVVQLLLQKHEPDEYELPKTRDVLPEETKSEPSNDNAEELTCKNEEAQESLDKENDIKESDNSTEQACIVGEETTEESLKEEEKNEVPEDCKEITEAKEEDNTDVNNSEEVIGEAIVEETPQVQTHEEVAEPVPTVEDETEKLYEQNDKISEEVLEESQKVDDYNGAEVLPEADTEVTSLVEEPSEVTEKVEMHANVETKDVADEAKVSVAETTAEVTSREVEVSSIALENLKSDAPEEETVERCEVVPESDTKGIDDVAEDKITVDQAFDEGVSEEPSTLISEEKELIASEHEQKKEVEVPTEEETGDILDTRDEIIADQTVCEEIIETPLSQERELEASEFALDKLQAVDEIKEAPEVYPEIIEVVSSDETYGEGIIKEQIQSPSSTLLPEEKEHETTAQQNSTEQECTKEVQVSANEETQALLETSQVEKEEPSALEVSEVNETEQVNETLSIKEVSKDDATADHIASDVITDMPLPEKIEEVKADEAAALDKNLEEEYAKETQVFADEDTKDVIEPSSEEIMHSQEEKSRELKVSELSPECEEKITPTPESTVVASKDDVVAEKLLPQHDEQLLVSPALVYTALHKEELEDSKDQVETEAENESREEKYPEEKSDTLTAPTDYHHEVPKVDETGNLSGDIKSFEDYIPHEKQELTCESSTTQVTYPVEKESSLEISQGVLDVEEADGTTQDKRQLDEESHAAEIPSSKDEVLHCVHDPESEDNKLSDDTLVASESKEEKFSESGTAEVDSTSAQISLSEKLMEEQTNERVSHDHEDEEDEDEDEEKEDTEHKQASHSSDEPVIVEASRDSEVRVSPKKSHNILSGMGKSVKHSISKVKKAIIGKSSNSKTQPEK